MPRPLVECLDGGRVRAAQLGLARASAAQRDCVRDFALLTSTAHVIPLDAPPAQYAAGAPCVLAGAYVLLPEYGAPLRIIRPSLSRAPAPRFAPAQVTLAVEAAREAREAEQREGRAWDALLHDPAAAQHDALARASESAVERRRRAVAALADPAPAADAAALLASVRAHAGRGVHAVHVAMVGAHEWSVERLRAVDGVSLVYPAWLCPTPRGLGDIERVLAFVRSRHDDARYNELLLDPCVPRACAQHATLAELDRLQNIPAWLWARVSLLCAWMDLARPPAARLRRAASALRVPEPVARQLERRRAAR